MKKLWAFTLAILPMGHAVSAAPLSDFCLFLSPDILEKVADCSATKGCYPVDEFPEVFEHYRSLEERASNYVLSKLSSSKKCMTYRDLLAGSGVENCSSGQVPFVWAIFDLEAAELISSNNSDDPEFWTLGLAENGECA